ncbi:MAG: hypothetical protein AB9903_21995 [Vulcanimicrobiota bacterium]
MNFDILAVSYFHRSFNSLQAFNTPVDWNWHEENNAAIIKHMHNAFTYFTHELTDEKMARLDSDFAFI